MSNAEFWAQYKHPQWQRKRADMEMVIGYIAAINYDHDVGNGEPARLVVNSWEEAAGASAFFHRDIAEFVELASKNSGVVWRYSPTA